MVGEPDFTLPFVNDGPSAVTGACIRRLRCPKAGMGMTAFVSASVAASAAPTSRTIAGAAFNGTASALPVASTPDRGCCVCDSAEETHWRGGQHRDWSGHRPAPTDTNLSNNSGTVTVNIGATGGPEHQQDGHPTSILVDQTTCSVTVRNLEP